MLKRHIGDYNFVADTRTGTTLRWGKTLHENPIFAPVPELADISISNHCTKKCSFCYRSSSNNNEFMTVEQYCQVLEAMNHSVYGNVFQVALGGGEPLEHPNFLDIINETTQRHIVPNFTTNGIHLNSSICKSIKGKVGAVAISITKANQIPHEKLLMLINEGIKVNIHYVLSSENIDEATSILEGRKNEFFMGVNAIIFLTYKPSGRAEKNGVIIKGESLDRFLKSVNFKNINRPSIGFDACFVPMLLHSTNITPALVDTCEAAFFSVYIDHKMNVSPCSFSNKQDQYNLMQYDFYDIWLNKFKKYRERTKNNCKNINCLSYSICRGCCPYYPEITTCYEK